MRTSVQPISVRTAVVIVYRLTSCFAAFLNNHDAAVRTGHRAANHQQIVFRIDPRHGQSFYRDAHVAHVTRRPHALDNSRRIRRRANRTGRAHVHRTVRLRTAIEIVTLDRAGKAATFRLADHVDDVAIGKLIDQNLVADIRAVVRSSSRRNSFRIRVGGMPPPVFSKWPRIGLVTFFSFSGLSSTRPTCTAS